MYSLTNVFSLLQTCSAEFVEGLKAFPEVDRRVFAVGPHLLWFRVLGLGFRVSGLGFRV
jgi:hypothetical protein